jgi:ankyrin repeat protein
MLFSLKKLFNRRSEESIQRLNRDFLSAIPRDWDHSEAFERELQKKLVEFLDKGADIDAKDGLGWTALARLAIWGYTLPAIALLERKADVNVSDNCNMTAVWGAAQNSNAALLKAMLDKGANMLDQKFMDSGLLGCAAGGRVNGEEDIEKKIACVEMLLAKGLVFKDRDKRTAWHYAYLAPYIPGFAEAKEMETAARTGDLAKVRELLAAGVQPDCLDEYGQDTPLFIASSRGDIPMMEALIKRGADLNIMCACSDQTPLMAAAKSGKMEALELLVESGADIAVHYRYERDSCDEPGHSRPNLYTSAKTGGPAIEQRVEELLGPSIALRRRTTIMKPLRLGKRS